MVRIGIVAALLLAMAVPVGAQTVTFRFPKVEFTGTGENDIRAIGPVNFNASGADGTGAVVAYISNVGYPTTYRHKITSSVSSNTALGFLTFSMDTGESTFLDLVTLRSTGRVGIGTTAPTEIFEIVKDGTPADYAFGLKILSAADDTTLVMGASAGSDYSYIQSAKSFDTWTGRQLRLQPMGGETLVGGMLFTRTVEAVTTTKTPDVTESGEVYTNEGDGDGATLTLPAAATGLTVTVYVQAAQTLTVTAGAGDTIRMAGNVTAAAGSVTSAVVGSSVTLVAINATEWVAVSVVGSWTF